MSDTILHELVALTRHLGEPERRYVILGEGNTSARIDAERYWVKSSGFPMHEITADGFTQVYIRPVLEIITGPDLDDAAIRAALAAAKVDPAGRHPSIETLVHALALDLCGATFVGHTHAEAVNAILCSAGAREALAGHIDAESALYLGAHPLIVPYADPGVALARAVRAELVRHLDAHGAPPRVIYLLNHGLFTLGASAAEVKNIMAIAAKAATILRGTYAFGGPAFLSPTEVDRICTRPDEAARRRAANAGTQPDPP